MKVSRNRALGMVCAGLLTSTLLATADLKRIWSFDDETPGRIARDMSGFVGEWKVVDSDNGRSLAQSAKNADPIFNLALIDDARARDLILSVRIKPVAGELDRGGGLVWRAKDATNYYLARYNPLENNFRVYTVIAGKRTMLKNADIPHHDGWFTLRVEMEGDRIACYLDGTKSLEVRDSTFREAGKIGLWSKSDAQSQFDDLTLEVR